MSFVSYAQNFEDVILWRALHDVQGGQYIDIGAQEPEFDSVSFAFYKAGWRGIHVEPTPTYAERLREARPDERVVQAAVTDAPGPILFYELGGLSSGRADVAERHVHNGHKPREILVPTVRLDDLLDINQGELHWLKIDVEGMEADVLRSWGESKKHPWILVIESTFPNSQETTEKLWIDQVLARGYTEVLFDGLSRFFVHERHPELADRLNRPANVFDDFQITSKHFASVLTSEQAEEQRKASEARIAALSLDVLQTRERVHAREAQFTAEQARLAGEITRRADDADQLRAQLRSVEGELAVEHARLAQLDERGQIQRKARTELNSELLRISRLVGSDADEFVPARDDDRWLPAGTTYGAVKSHLTLAKHELNAAREFAVQQFLAGQKSRDAELGFLGGRVSSLENEIGEARGRLAESAIRADTDRARLQSMVDEQAAALHAIKSEAEQVDEQLADARDVVRSIYTSRRGRIASWLGLLPPQSSGRARIIAPEGPVAPVMESYETEQMSEIARQSGMDNLVSDIRHTSNLLALNGSALVDALYRTFLKRSADRAGRDHFVARLQSGDAKEDVLLAIASSPEARAVAAKIDGLAELQVTRKRVARRSLFGRNRAGNALEARLNRLEYGIGEAHNSVVHRLDRMESSLEQIQATLDSGGAARQIGPAREAGVYVQGVPVSIKRGVSMKPTNGAAEFIEELRGSVQSSMEALSLRYGR